MARPDSKWPKIETAIAIKKDDSARFCLIFKTGEWRRINKSGFFDVKYYIVENIIFQRMSVKEQVFNPYKNRLEEVNHFGNGYIIQHLSSVEFE